MAEINLIRTSLTDYQLMWLSWAMLDKGHSPTQIVDALSPPYDRDKIKRWLGEAGPSALALGAGKSQLIEPNAFAALVYEAQQQQAEDPATEEDKGYQD